MKRINFFIVLAFLFLSNYALAQIPSCPCDTQELLNGTTGNDVVELLCPGGEAGENTNFAIDQTGIVIFSGDPGSEGFLGYQAIFIPDVIQICEFAQGNVQNVTEITEQEFEVCKSSLIERCNLRINNPIPTLSEWGMISAALGFGLIGLFFAARRRKATA